MAEKLSIEEARDKIDSELCLLLDKEDLQLLESLLRRIRCEACEEIKQIKPQQIMQRHDGYETNRIHGKNLLLEEIHSKIKEKR